MDKDIPVSSPKELPPPLQPGVYVIRNLKNDHVADLSCGDHRSLVSWPHHNEENQQVSLPVIITIPISTTPLGF